MIALLQTDSIRYSPNSTNSKKTKQQEYEKENYFQYVKLISSLLLFISILLLEIHGVNCCIDIMGLTT
jgi:preprotein translocase subunit SecF